MSTEKKKWRDFSTVERSVVIAASALELGLQGAALVDLYRRPTSDVRGRKGWWVAASFVNFVGPLAYFALGRR
ncbi:MAG: PLD nuclease N-terminal domain-containing protein [Propionibacteriaceae bacterium]|nr:PLD nuclease N-terminal domain-containing protein [Propionibacteriaceae bacterium]